MVIQDLVISEGKQLLGDNYIGHLSYIAGEWPYSVPITYYYNQAKNYIISYSAEGHKVRAMRKNPNVSLTVNEIQSVNEWRSIQIHGQFEELRAIDAKYHLHEFAEGVKRILLRTEGKDARSVSDFSSKLNSEKHPIVFRVQIDDMIAKYREE